MKGRHLLSFILFTLILVFGCTREIPIQQTVVRDGRLYEKGEAVPYTGVVTGKTRKTAALGERIYRKAYRDGVLHGDTRFWYPDGHLESIEPYRNGRINGIYICYNPDGRIRAKVHLVNGLRGGEHGEVFWGEGRGPKTGFVHF